MSKRKSAPLVARRRKPDLPHQTRRATQLAMAWHDITERIVHGERKVAWDQVSPYLRGVIIAGFEQLIEDGYVVPARYWDDGHGMISLPGHGQPR